MRPVNTYIVGNPIKDQAAFFGRQDIFREVLQVLRQRGSNAIVLYGQRRIGKTSVLLQLEKQLARDGEFTPVYFDLQDKAAKSLAEVLYELSQHIAKVTGHTAPRSSDFDRTGDCFRTVFLPDVAEKVASGGLVLLFDEFDVLDSPVRTQASESFFPYLRAWMTDVQKVKFVFVIGRRPEDLSVRTMSTFKGIQCTRVSFLSEKDTEDLIRQSEKDNSLEWKVDAVRRVFDLTHGHPYFTQLLCSVVWENAYETEPRGIPLISAEDVEGAIAQALKFGGHAFNWLWDGLPPAERVVVAAMAEVTEEVITQDRLIETLNQSGVRLVARELEFAPETLIDWQLLIEANGAYRFAIPLLRRWVLANRPLRRVKEELDRLDPLADTLFQGGQGFYNNNNSEAAEQQLRQALNINPNHLKARLLLGQVLLEKGNLAESVSMFEAAYQYDERAARAHLIKSLLALAETQEENLQLSTYERILKIQSDQPLANEKIGAIWVQRGEASLAQENFEEALKAFERIGDTERLEKARHLMHEKKLALDMQMADAYEKSGKWKSALDALVQLTAEYPESEILQARLKSARVNWHAECLDRIRIAEEEENWEKAFEICQMAEKEFPDDTQIRSCIDRADAQIRLTQKYHEALGALQSGQNDRARQIFSQVLAENPKHLQAAHKLIEATYGEVKITRPSSWLVWIPVGITSLVWVLLGTLVANALLLTFWFRSISRIPIETIILVATSLVALIGIGVTLVVRHVLDAAFRVDLRGKPSFGRALWTHLPFGAGLFYVDQRARRKWIYLFTAMIIPVILVAGPFLYKDVFDKTNQFRPGFFTYSITGHDVEVYRVSQEGEGAWNVALGISGAIYLLSFVDVMGSCYARRKSSYRKKGEIRERMPGVVKEVSGQSRTEQTPAMGQPGQFAAKTRLSLQRIPRWLIVVIGVLPLLTLAVLDQLSTSDSAPFPILAVAWFAMALFVAFGRTEKTETAGPIGPDVEDLDLTKK